MKNGINIIIITIFIIINIIIIIIIIIIIKEVGGAGVSRLAQNDLMNHLCFS